MKKEILITVGAVCGTTSLIAAGVFLPTLFSSSSPSTVQVNSNTALISPNTKSSISVKEALLGTKQINNGNYVLYFGSEGLEQNFKFLYNTPKNPVDGQLKEIMEEQTEKRNKELSGDYWSAINYVLNGENVSENIGTKPEFIAYVNILGQSTISSRESIAKEATKLLKDVLEVRETYTDLDTDKKDEILKKFNYVKTSIQDSALIKDYLNYSELTSFYEALKKPFKDAVNAPGNLSPELANKTLYEAVNWEISPRIVKFETNPFSTYSTWDSQTRYYDESSYAQEFRDLWDFIKNYPLFGSRVREIDTTSGVIVGYKDGKLVDFYEGSFNSGSTDDGTTDGEGTGDGESSDSTTETQSIRFSDLRASQATNSSLSEPLNNSFYNWLKTSYPAQNSDSASSTN
ncbi:MAG: hypothetical protein K2I49_01740 [Ureaplasma sp.]|nr:hypothetical protein [Ureaplasma sp.]